MENDLLHYGSLITLSISDSYYIYSKGFIDNSVYLQEIQETGEPDFQGAVFRVLPQYTYTMQTEILNGIAELTPSYFQEKLLRQDESLEGEIKTNIQTYRNSKGAPIRFGAVVQLEHLTSHKFLTLISQENAELEKDNLKLALTDFANDYSHFHIQSCYRFQKEGDTIIHANDKVILEIVVPELGKPAYINSSSNEFPQSFRFSKLMELNALVNKPEKNKLFEMGAVKEVNASLDYSSKWKVSIFAGQNDDPNALAIGECIWLTHSEEAACLVSQIKDLNEQKFETFFSENLNNTNGLWKIEGLDEKTGGKIAFYESYRFRHVSTGLYLSTQPHDRRMTDVHNLSKILVKHARLEANFRLKLSGKHDPNTAWQFYPLKSNKQTFVNKDEYFMLFNENNNVYLQVKIDNKIDRNTRISPVLSNYQTEHCFFKGHKCDDTLICETLFLLNCMPILQGFPAFIEKYCQLLSHEDKYFKYREFKMQAKFLIRSVEDLDQFCQNKLQSMITIDRQYGEIQYSRQKILREQGFIYALAEVLNSSFVGPLSLKNIHRLFKKNPEASKRRFSVKITESLDIDECALLDMIHIARTIYELLITLCKRNPENQSYAFSFFRIFRKHAGYGLGASKCMTSILKDNEVLLMKLHTGQSPEDSMISHYTRLLRKFSRDRKPQLLEFLRSICTYQGEGMSVNQEKIHELLFGSPETYSKVIITTLIDNEHPNSFQLTLQHPSGLGEEFVQLEDCFNLSHMDSKLHNQLEYFTKMLDLFADMCKGRNYICKGSIKEWFPIDSLLHNMWNTKLPVEIRSGFCKLMLNMHIDSYPRHETKRPELIRVLRLVSKYNKKLSYKEKHSILRADSQYDIQNVQRRFTTDKGPRVPYNSTKTRLREDTTMDEDDTLELETDIFTLHRLRINILDYLYNTEDFNILTLEILRMSAKMAKFELFGAFCSDDEKGILIINHKSPKFKMEEMSIVKLIKAIQPLLFQERKDRSRARATSNADKEYRRQPFSYNFLSEILRISNSINDPTVRYAINLKNYLTSIFQKTSVLKEEDNFEVLCKLQICEIFSFLMDWRQDFLIKNVVDWFNKVGVGGWTPEQFLTLMPSIVEVNLPDKRIARKLKDSSKFIAYDGLEIPDLNCFGRSIIPALIKVFIQTPEISVQGQILNLLFKSFSQRAELLKNINKMHVMTMLQDTDLFSWAKINLATFKQHSEQSELWLKYWQQSNFLMHKNINKFDIVLNILDHFVNILYEDTVIANGVPVVGDRVKISKDRQTMMFYLGVHEFVINLIRDGMHSLAELFENERYFHFREPKLRLTTLFKACHHVLSQFVQENPKNQKALFKSLDLITCYLRHPVGQFELIEEIFKDNIELCSHVSEQFLQLFIDLIITQGRQAVFLRIFEIVQIPNNEPLQDIQRLVLLMFLKSPHRQHLLYMDSNSEFTFEKKDDMDEPFEYHARLLEVFKNCGAGSTGVYLNEAKCQKLFPLKAIFSLLDLAENDENYHKLQVPMLNYFYHIYLDTEKRSDEISQFKPFFGYLRAQAAKLNASYVKNSVDTDFFGLFVRILFLYCERYIKTEEEGVVRNQEGVHAIKEAVIAIVRVWDLVDITKLPNEAMAEAEQLAWYFNMYVQINSPKLGHFGDSFDFSESEDNCNIRSSWSRFKYELIHNSELKKLIKKERKALNLTLSFIHEYFEGISHEVFAKKLAAYIRNSATNQDCEDTIIFSVELLSLFLSKPIKMSLTETKAEAKLRMQYTFNQLGAVRVTLQLMCDPNALPSVFDYLLIFCVKLLDGGNQHLQQEFYQYFINIPNSELFFARIYKKITAHTEIVAFKPPPENMLLPIYKKRDRSIKHILRLLQLLCENHNTLLQNYLRNQEQSRNSYDLVLATTQLLEELMKKKYLRHFLVVSQCFDTLTEFIQGPCRENQRTIIDSKFIEIATSLLSLNERSPYLRRYENLIAEMSHRTTITRMNSSLDMKPFFPGWVVAHLKYKCMITILSLLEGQTDNYIVTKMMRNINIDILKENLISVYSSYLEYYGESYYDYDIFNHHESNEKYKFGRINDQDEDPTYYQVIIETGFLIYHLIRNFQDNDDLEVKNIMESFLKNSSDPNTNATSVRKRDKSRVYIAHPEDRNAILQQSWGFFSKHSGNVEVIFGGNILCKVYFWVPPEAQYLTPDMKESFHSRVDRASDKTKLLSLQLQAYDILEQMEHETKLAKVFGKHRCLALSVKYINRLRDLAFVTTIIINLLIICSYSSYSDSRLYEPSLFYELDPTTTILLITILGIVQCSSSIIIVAFFIIKNAPVLLKKGMRSLNTENKGCWRWLKKLFYGAYLMLRDVHILYNLLYLFFSVLGIFLHPFFFSWHLLDVIYRNRSLQNVIQSIVIPRESLILSFVLTLILAYIFSIWGYVSFNSFFRDDCPSLWVCMITTFDKGFKYDGGIGGYLDPWDKGTVDFYRVLFDNMYNILIMIIMMNIFQGIIIDTFAVLRESQAKNTLDRMNKCFICGIDKETIERSTNQSFRFHITEEHNEWNYLFFMAYLDKKEQTEYTGIESHVKDRINKKDINWFPQHRALSIKEFFDSDEQIINDKVEAIQRDVDTVKQDIKDLKASITELVEKLK